MSQGDGLPPAVAAKKRLIVILRDGPERTVTLDFTDAARLEEQLRAFERARTVQPRDEYQLHEFNNAAGETVAFVDRLYLRHEVIPLDGAG